MRQVLIYINFILLLPIVLFAQNPTTGSVSGFVYDDSNGEALIGANLFLKDTGRGSSTNSNGYFVIPRLLAGKYLLVVHFIGYKGFTKNITIQANASVEIKVNLQPEALVAEEVVVVADFDNRADLLRSLQPLPGILPISDFSSAFMCAAARRIRISICSMARTCTILSTPSACFPPAGFTHRRRRHRCVRLGGRGHGLF